MKKKLDKNEEKVYTLQHGENVVQKHPSKPEDSVSHKTEGKPRSFSTPHGLPAKENPMSKSSISSFGSRFQRVSLALVGGVAALLLAACGGGGGGGSATPASTTPEKTAQEVKITNVAIGNLAIDGATVTPDEPALVSVTYDAGGMQGTASMAVTCAGSPVATAIATATANKLDFTHNPWAVGSCSGTVTVSATGYTSATRTFTFTVKEAAPKAVTYKADLFITLNGEIGQSLYENGTFTDKLMQNGTQYTLMADCTLVYIADEVLYKTDTGLPVARCFDQTNVQRDVEVDVVAGKLGRTVTTPVGVVTHSTGYTPSSRFAAQGVSALGRYSLSQLNDGDVHYVADAGAMVHWVAPNGDFTKSYQVTNLTGSGTYYKGFVSVSN